jgi:N-acetylmuramoyl-L-alanine amidase
MIKPNEYSRPSRKLKSVNAIVIHWPSWSNASAQIIHDYFYTDIPKEKRYASAHYVVGLDGEIAQCIPDDEIAYHCGSAKLDPKSGRVYTDKAREVFGEYASNPNLSPNQVSIGIEVCHIDDKGTMNKVTVDSLVRFVSELCVTYSLDPSRQVLRHYDVVGWKDCPRYWVNNLEAWNRFIMEVEECQS